MRALAVWKARNCADWWRGSSQVLSGGEAGVYNA